MKILCFIIVVIAMICFFKFTKTGKRLKIRVSGTSDEKFTEDASTPEGAKAYYNSAIALAEKKYSDEYGKYIQQTGKIKSYEEQLRVLKKEDMQLDLNIKSCIDKNDDNAAKVYLIKQKNNEEKAEIIKKNLEDLRSAAKLQDEVVKNLHDELENLKAEKEVSILALETAEATKSLQATSGISTNEEDKMLEKVREGVKKSKEVAEGSKIAYESSYEVQKKRLDKQMKDDEIQKKLDELKAGKKK